MLTRALWTVSEWLADELRGPTFTLEPLTASLPTPDSLNPHGGPGGQGLNSAGPGPGTPLYPGPSPGPGPNPGFATPTHGGGGGHTPLPGQGGHFVHGPPSYNSSPVPPGPSTPGQGGGNSNHFPSPGPGYNPQGGPGGTNTHLTGTFSESCSRCVVCQVPVRISTVPQVPRHRSVRRTRVLEA